MVELNWGGGGFLPPIHYKSISDPVQNRVRTGVRCYTGSKGLDYPHNCKTENNVCNLTVEGQCLQAMKIAHLEHMPSLFNFSLCMVF